MQVEYPPLQQMPTSESAVESYTFWLSQRSSKTLVKG
jgi:hypothetical protein